MKILNFDNFISESEIDLDETFIRVYFGDIKMAANEDCATAVFKFFNTNRYAPIPLYMLSEDNDNRIDTSLREVLSKIEFNKPEFEIRLELEDEEANKKYSTSGKKYLRDVVIKGIKNPINKIDIDKIVTIKYFPSPNTWDFDIVLLTAENLKTMIRELRGSITGHNYNV